MGPFNSSESLFGCTHLVLLLETETVRNYRKRVRQCEALAEYALAEQLRAILVQQQDHQMYRSLQNIQQRLDFQT
jgi:bacterioferritin